VRAQFLEHNVGRNLHTRRWAAFERELQYVHRLLPTFASRRVLDLGCGPGALTEFLLHQGAQVHAIDFDLDLIKAAVHRTREHAEHARFLVGRVERLPYRDAVFDACMADSILEHVPKWEQTLREVTRVLKPGGVLVFYTVNRLHPFTGEIRHFPGYPWLPDRLKNRILDWVMRSRPELVNYTEYPAVSWFTYEQVRDFLEPLGYRVRTRLDLVETQWLSGWKRMAAQRLLPLRQLRLARWAYYVYAPEVSVYAIKVPELVSGGAARS
jgi:ubiquinone/menaquinone biosynthesis C-methylase UbiE